MDAGAKITIKENGRLKALGASNNKITFTAYGGTHWKGIEVLGDPTKHTQPNWDNSGGNYAINGEDKGTAYLWDCIIEKCNYGIVAGEITSTGINVKNSGGKGGGILDINYTTFQYVDYYGIVLTPFKATWSGLGFPIAIPTGNASSISYVTIYDDYQNDDFKGLALYGVWLPGATWYNTIKCRVYGNKVVAVFGKRNFGIYIENSALNLESSTIEGFHNGIKIINANSSYSTYIYANTLTNNWWDIHAENIKNVSIQGNTSTKDMGCVNNSCPVNVEFARINGDGWWVGSNAVSLTNKGSHHGYNFVGSTDVAVFHLSSSTPTVKRVDFNSITGYSYGCISEQNNFGAKFSCNTFSSSAQDIYIGSGGVAAYQGSALKAENNTFHSFNPTCTTTEHWYKASGASNTVYWYKTLGYPTCKNTTINQSNFAKNCAASNYIIAPPNNRPSMGFYVDKIDSLMTDMSHLPSVPSLMNEDELSEYTDLNHLRDAYLNEIVQYYTDLGRFDSAFYYLDEYPCAEASLKKLDLEITIGELENLDVLINEVVDAFSYQEGENIYYDTEFSGQVPDFYPLLIQFIQNDYSDSILTALDGDLESLADEGGYLGGAAQNILCAQEDGDWDEITPRGENWQPACGEESITVEEEGGGMPASVLELKDNKIEVYPNPASNILNIVNLSVRTPVHFRLISATGKQEMSGTFLRDNEKIDINFLSAGIYIIELKNERFSKVIKFAKQ